jgi:hypothetical protein
MIGHDFTVVVVVAPGRGLLRVRALVEDMANREAGLLSQRPRPS